MPCLAIETGIEPEYENRLIQSAKNAGWEVQEVFHVPFTHVFQDLPDGFALREDVWFHGAIEAVKTAQRTTCWQVHAPWKQLEYLHYREHLKAVLTNAKHEVVTLTELSEKRGELWNKFGNSFFVRPNTCDKVFNGGVINKWDYDHQLKLINFYDPPKETLCIVAPLQNVSAEARFLIVNGKIITGSYYKIGGQFIRLEADNKLMNIANRALRYCLRRGYNPAPSWVLDLAKGPNRGWNDWTILEPGATSCCGLYKCNTDAFVNALATTFPM